VRTAAIVVTYNRKKLLLENLECLLKQDTTCDLDVLVIDNNSSDGTLDAIKNHNLLDKIIYINTGENLGGAGGFQFGIKYAAERLYDYIWVMDDDCMPKHDSLEKLLEVAEKKQDHFGFLASKVLWKDGRICTMNIPRETMFKSVTDFDDKIVPVVMASFVSLLLPVRVVREVGLPIKEFFIWTDDWEYTRRISRRMPGYLVNGSVVVHKSKNNYGANIAYEASDRLSRYQYLYRNDVYLYRREGILGLLYEIVRLLDHTLRVVFKAKDHKLMRLRCIWKSTIQGLTFNPTIEFPKEKVSE
jgi:GT2 family glycosyltransferase